MSDWQEVEEREGKKFMQQLVDENIALRAENARLKKALALALKDAIVELGDAE